MLVMYWDRGGYVLEMVEIGGDNITLDQNSCFYPDLNDKVPIYGHLCKT
jgi:hypothetical protein